ncbi:MAG TPA: hypothetical protein VK898_14945 [Chloroflexota bacterium]|nr:hypothetical protein [Chloroflexota bacterium]
MLCETPASWPICFMVIRLGAGRGARRGLLDIPHTYAINKPDMLNRHIVEGVQFSGMKN